MREQERIVLAWLFAGVMAVMLPAVPASAVEPVTPEPAPRAVVWMDYYHHQLPDQKIGNLLLTGSFTDPIGRYGFDDLVHSNSFAPLVAELESQYALTPREEPFVEERLAGTDIVFIFTPDSPEVADDATVISDAEIDALEHFVRGGGSVVVMANGFAELETFEIPQFHKLLQRFGVDWVELDTGTPEWAIPAGHPWFYDVGMFHYGGGCLFHFTDDAEHPQTLLTLGHDPKFPDLSADGKVIVMTRPGRGKFLAVGDTGSFSGNLDRPWTNNDAVLQQIFGHARPDAGITHAGVSPGNTHRYRVNSTAATVRNYDAFDDLDFAGHELVQPRPYTPIHYINTSATLILEAAQPDDRGRVTLNATVTADDESDLEAVRARLVLSRLGELAEVEDSAGAFATMIPDVASLAAFVPNDGVRPGDRWTKRHRWSVPSIVPRTTAPYRDVLAETIYTGDEELQDRACRRLLTTAVVTLTELDLLAEDVIPASARSAWGGARWQWDRGGGRLLLKLEQWIDAETGLLRRARAQSRVVLFVRDTKTDAETVVVTARQSEMDLLD